MESKLSVTTLSCNSPPQIGGWYKSNNPKLDGNVLKGWGSSDFVKKKKSAIWSWEVTVRSFRIPAWSFSLTKWQSISKCLVLSWNTGLTVIWMTIWLSQKRTGTLGLWMCRSLSRYKIHWSSHVAEVEAKAWYSASEEDLETVICFLVLHEMKDFPMKKHWPVMERLVSTHPAQSVCENPCKWSEESLGKNKPSLGQPLRYLRTLNAAVRYDWVGLERNWLNCCVMKVISETWWC